MPDDVSAIELWNEALALELPGKLLLVGLTFTDRACTSEQQEQFWGRVVAVGQRAGIQLLLKGGGRVKRSFFHQTCALSSQLRRASTVFDQHVRLL